MDKLLSLIFPAYNEALRIESTLMETVSFFESNQWPYELIVVVDGDDGTREIAAEFAQKHPQVRVIGSGNRRGKGYGIREGVKIAKGEIIGFSDADNKTAISELFKVMPRFKEGYDLVIGSRADKESIIERRQPLYRRLGSKVFAVFMHFVTGLWDIPDTQCGFKFFQSQVAHNLFQLQEIDGYMFDVEILYLAKKLGYRIAQVPIRWCDDADSRLNLIWGNVQNFKDVIRVRFRPYPELKQTSEMIKYEDYDG